MSGMSTYFSLQGVLTGERKQRKLYGRHRSLVRQVGSLLPLKSPPWFYLGSGHQHYNVGIGNVFSQCLLEEDPGYQELLVMILWWRQLVASGLIWLVSKHVGVLPIYILYVLYSTSYFFVADTNVLLHFLVSEMIFL